MDTQGTCWDAPSRWSSRSHGLVSVGSSCHSHLVEAEEAACLCTCMLCSADILQLSSKDSPVLLQAFKKFLSFKARRANQNITISCASFTKPSKSKEAVAAAGSCPRCAATAAKNCELIGDHVGTCKDSAKWNAKMGGKGSQKFSSEMPP